MLFLGILFLPVLLAENVQHTIGTFKVLLTNGTLTNVIPIDNITINNSLDLSGLNISNIDRQALDNLAELEELNLSRNSFTHLPEFIFANLTKLTSLSLSNNKIYSLENVLVGLQNLKTLDLSHTLIRHIRRGHLFSLPESAKIITKGNIFQALSNMAFDNPFLKNDAESIEYERQRFEISVRQGCETNHDAEELQQFRKLKSHSEIHLDKELKVKLCCSNDGTVTSLEELEKEEILSEKCVEVPIDYEKRKVILKNLKIVDFDRDWYRLQKMRILELDLSKNRISKITSDMLNDLPGDLISVNLMGNRIKNIDRNIIENCHLKHLFLTGNEIETIEDGAFEHTKLTDLHLTFNNLSNLNFSRSLPSTLTGLSIDFNRIKTIPDDAFSRLSNLLFLTLQRNLISSLRKDSFRGLRSLNVLDITENQVERIEPGAFHSLHALEILNLYKNKIVIIEKGTFEGLFSLKAMNLARNGITNITRFTFSDLPMSLDYLYLSYNEIQYLESGSFVAVPRITLSLDGNRISSIPKAAFDLPFLQNLHLYNNSLKAMDADAYIRVPYLKKLWLGANHIETIDKGATRNLGYLSILDISKNYINKLESGVFYGLPKFRGHFVYLGENQIEYIEGGIFEDYL